MKLKHNAEQILKEYFARDNVVATKKALITNINNSYKHKFFQELQIYVTKIGLALVDCYEGAYLKANTYLGSIDFLCKRVIRKEQIYNVMKSININDNGNSNKHSLKDVEGDIDYTLQHYNHMIRELVYSTKLQTLKQCFLNKKNDERNAPLVAEKKDHKYFVMKHEKYSGNNEIKLELKINSYYEVDPYTKKGLGTLMLCWPNSYEDYYINIKLTNTKTQKEICSKNHISLKEGKSSQSLPIYFCDSDLDKRVISLDVKLELLYEEDRCYTTGILAWKKYHSYKSYNTVDTRNEKLSHFYKQR